jgi:hypothetical protein
MALARPTGRTAGKPAAFGQRGRARVKASAPPLPRTVDPRGDAPRETVASPPPPGVGIALSASRGKAYATAVLAGATAFIAALFVLTGVENRLFQAGPVLVFLAVPILPTLALVLYIPTVILSDIARLLSIPRGWADLGIGLLLGSGLGIAVAMTGPAVDRKSILTALALTAGGLMGGFAFWRAQGYPGASRGSTAALDQAYDTLT